MEKYFNYPLCLLQRINDDEDKKGLLDIISFAVMNFSERINYSPDSITKQMIYLYYRRPYFLTDPVKNHIDRLYEEEAIEKDEDYQGFTSMGEAFDPEIEKLDLKKEFDTSPEFYRECVDIYKQHQAVELLKLNPELITEIRQQYEIVKKFFESFESKNGPDAWTSVSNNMIFNVFNGTLSLDYLRLISAVKSVLNKKNLNLTYKSVQLCRMFGCKKMQILNELFNENPELRVKHALLSRRRQWEKLIDSAMEKGYFSYFSTGRQFFVSITMTKDELKNTVEKRQNDYAKIKISA